MGEMSGEIPTVFHRPEIAGGAPARRFAEVLAKMSAEQQAVLRGVTAQNSPKAGADFLTKGSRNPQDTVPLLFSLLIADDVVSSDKVNALTNVRNALLYPSSSELSQKVPGDPDSFFDNLVRRAGKNELGFTPSPQAKNYLTTVLTNFHAGEASSPMQTLAGENLSIFRTENGLVCGYPLFLETVIAGTLDANMPAAFRQTLARTLLFAGTNQQFFKQEEIFSQRASYTTTTEIPSLIPKIMQSETATQREVRQRQEQTANLQGQLDQTADQLRTTQATLARTQEQASNLQAQLSNAEADLAWTQTELETVRQNLRNVTNNSGLRDQELTRAAQKITQLQERIRQLENDLALEKGKTGKQPRGAKTPPAPEAPDTRTPYQILGLRPGATPDQILKAFRHRSKTSHPDYVTGGAVEEAAKAGAIDADVVAKLRAWAEREQMKINDALEKLGPKNGAR